MIVCLFSTMRADTLVAWTALFLHVRAKSPSELDHICHSLDRECSKEIHGDFDKLFGLRGSSGVIELTRNITQETQDQLDQLVNRLKSFINGMDFDGVYFLKVADRLSIQVSAVSNWVNHVFPRNNELQKRLGFAIHMFNVMLNARNLLEFYTERGHHQQLVRGLIFLKVRLLSLHTSDGEPDSRALGYASDVATFTRLLESWGIFFDQLEAIPPSVRLMFETQYVEISCTLQNLANGIRTTENRFYGYQKACQDPLAASVRNGQVLTETGP